MWYEVPAVRMRRLRLFEGESSYRLCFVIMDLLEGLSLIFHLSK